MALKLYEERIPKIQFAVSVNEKVGQIRNSGIKLCRRRAVSVDSFDNNAETHFLHRQHEAVLQCRAEMHA